MAIGLKTASEFSIAELFAKLCQKNCDFCPKHAPYISLVNLHRRCHDDCTDKSPTCRGPPYRLRDTIKADNLAKYYKSQHQWLQTLRTKFIQYPKHVHSETCGPQARYDNTSQHLCTLVAPWLQARSMEAEYALSCGHENCAPAVDIYQMAMDWWNLERTFHGALNPQLQLPANPSPHWLLAAHYRIEDDFAGEWAHRSGPGLRKAWFLGRLLISSMTIYTEKELIKHEKTAHPELYAERQEKQSAN